MNISSLPRRLFVSLLLLACGGVSFAAPPVKSSKIAAPKVANPKTVADYFLLLPNKYVEMFSSDEYVRMRSWAERRRLLKDKKTILDIKNDYLFVPGIWPTSGQILVKLFRYSGGVLIGVQTDETKTSGNETTWLGTDVAILRHERGVWIYVTRQMVSAGIATDLEEGDYRTQIRLPRYGTTIKVNQPNGGYDLVWKNGRFKDENYYAP